MPPPAVADPVGVYGIGNSLLNDAVFPRIDGWDGNHQGNGVSLVYAHENPSAAIKSFPYTWDVAFATHQYENVVFQPYGETVAAHVAVISDWMTLQPQTGVIIHTSWPYHENLLAEGQATIDHAEAIVAALRAAFPGRSIVRDKTVESLLHIANDIAHGATPFSQVADLYRDHIHLTAAGGVHALPLRARGRRSWSPSVERLPESVAPRPQSCRRDCRRHRR